MSNQLMEKKNIELNLITEEEALTIINDIHNKINSVNEFGKQAITAAKDAKAADNAAKAAKNAAESTKTIMTTPGTFRGKKQAIIDTQSVVKGMAEVQISQSSALTSLAKAQESAAMAQIKSFESQKKLAELTKAMIAMGCTSLVKNRLMVREIEARLQGASEEEINDLAKQELYNVVAQLKMQQDIFSQQEQLTQIVREHDGHLLNIDEKNDYYDEKIIAQEVNNTEQDLKISRNKSQIDANTSLINMQIRKEDAINKAQDEKDAEHDARLDAGDEKDKLQDELLKQQAEEDARLKAETERQAEKDIEHDARLDAGDEKDKLQDELLKQQAEEDARLKAETERQAEKDIEHDARLDAGDEKDKLQDELLKQQAEEDARLKAETERQAVVDQEHSLLLQEHSDIIYQLTEQLTALQDKLNKKGDKTFLIITSACSAAALIISILHFFI